MKSVAEQNTSLSLSLFSIYLPAYHLEIMSRLLTLTFSPMAQQPPVSQGLLIIETSRSHSVTPQSVRILWMSYQPDTETYT